ncbi:MAG: RNA polymerase sigma factor [Bacilli bacterium]
MFFRSEVDDVAFYTYIEEHQATFYRLAYRYVNNKEDALDVVQDAIYKAITNKKSLKEEKYMRTWFYRIIVNCAIDRLRKQKKEMLLKEQYFLDETYSQFTHRSFDLEDAFTKLDDKHRIVIVLRFFEDMKIEEISQVLGINTNTVKTRLYAALKKLKVEMREYDDKEN